jgi:hypothetical protein
MLLICKCHPDISVKYLLTTKEKNNLLTKVLGLFPTPARTAFCARDNGNAISRASVSFGRALVGLDVRGNDLTGKHCHPHGNKD